MEIVLEGMPKSQQSRSNLDQNWLRGMGIVAEGMLESAVSVKSGSKLADKFGELSVRRYARITTPSVKSGSRLTERIVSEGMLESQQSR